MPIPALLLPYALVAVVIFTTVRFLEPSGQPWSLPDRIAGSVLWPVMLLIVIIDAIADRL